MPAVKLGISLCGAVGATEFDVPPYQAYETSRCGKHSVHHADSGESAATFCAGSYANYKSEEEQYRGGNERDEKPTANSVFDGFEQVVPPSDC